MSPLLKRLAGLLGRSAPVSSETPVDAEAPRRRRRRGGRGRGGGAAPATDSTAAAIPAPPARAPQQERAAPPRSRTSDAPPRSGNSYERRRAPRRLDQPLPEDIAFRPPAEGGDRSILPSRRRPPPGLKATKRVLVAGSRFVPRGPAVEDGDDIETDDVHQESQAVVAPADNESSEPTDPPARKRRRGRRGGRGRRRPDGAPQADPEES